jgi:hypothetical protein
MKISHVGHSIVHHPAQNFHIRNILHVPTASRNLLSVHRFTLDNGVFIEFHPFFFLIKDQVTKAILHRGRCVGGIYPFISSLVSPQDSKHAFVVVKPSQDKWHSRLGHPSIVIVRQVVSKNNLPCSSQSSLESICDSCQRKLKVISYLTLFPPVYLQLPYN